MLSLCMIARDEEQFLDACLDTVDELVDEVIIGIDSRTTDRTADIARHWGARVYEFHWSDSFAAARNLGLDRARGDWVLVIDPDERLLPEGRVQLERTLASDIPEHVDAYHTLIVEHTLTGAELSRAWSSSRVFRREPQLRYVGRVHEEVRYLPDPPCTWSERLDGGPHIVSLGSDPSLVDERKKRRRDVRLLRLRLNDNPRDAVALCYLALDAAADGLPRRAAVLARAALDCGPRTLHDDRRTELQQLVKRIS